MRKNYLSICFDPLIILDPAAFELFTWTKAEFVNFPLLQIKFLKMVLDSYEALYYFIWVLNWSQFTCINIRKVRPTIFTMMSLVIYDKIIAKGGSIIFMHANGELCLKGSEFFTFQFLRRGDEKALLFSVLFIYPLAGRLPRIRTIANHNIVKLSLSNCYRICNSITLFMESLSWKVIFCCSIQKLNIINLFLHYLLQVAEMAPHYSWSEISFIHIFILYLF